MSEKPPYTFIDETERKSLSRDDASSYEDCAELGRDVCGTILVKWTNQTYHDENLRAMFTDDWDKVSAISRANRGRHRNQYYAGLIVRACFDADYLDKGNAEYVEDIPQPTGVDTSIDGLTAYATANTILLRDGREKKERVISHPNFARLHDVEFSDDGQRILTASSSLDILYEMDLSGNETWALDLWDISDTNMLGQRFRRTTPENSEGWLINPDPVQLKDDPELRDAQCVLDDPANYGGLGLPTNLIPVFVNSIAYAHDGDILATSFHRGEGWKISRSGNQITVVAKDMQHPHGLRTDPLLGGYLVSDTGHEKVSFLSPDCRQELAVDFTELGGHKPGQEKVKWLQYTTRLDEDLYCAVLASRQRIVLFDPNSKVKREIPFDPDWGIQLVDA